MIFVPEVDTFIEYLETRNKFKKTQTELIRQNIFELPENIIVFNKDFINTVESIVDEQHPLKDSCDQFLKELIDSRGSGSINVEKNLDTIDKDLVFKQLNKYESENVLIGISESKEVIGDNSRILNINNIVKCNKNYVFSKLLTGQVCQISYLDFEDNNDLIPLLNHIYSLYINIEKAIIIDRYTNLSHQIYDGLIEKSPRFEYYTVRIDLQGANAVKRKLLKYRIYSTTNADLIHQRMIIFNKIIIVLDEDPNNIISRNTWTISIKYSSHEVTQIKNNTCTHFSSTLYSNC